VTPGTEMTRARRGGLDRRPRGNLDVVAPTGPRRTPRFSRRRGVLAGFAAFAAAGFVAAYIGPAGAALAEVDAQKVSLYESALVDVQTYALVSDPGTAPAALERGGYEVYVKPKPTPTPTAKPAQARSQGSSGGGWRPPFVSPDPGTAQAIAYDMVKARGWGDDQFACLQALWNKESGWRVNAYNAGSGAYGIPQALPGNKMASVGADWETNPATQITWGLGYIGSRYGDPCGAWGSSQSRGWY
jgi:hypothetical protein